MNDFIRTGEQCRVSDVAGLVVIDNVARLQAVAGCKVHGIRNILEPMIQQIGHVAGVGCVPGVHPGLLVCADGK